MSWRLESGNYYLRTSKNTREYVIDKVQFAWALAYLMPNKRIDYIRLDDFHQQSLSHAAFKSETPTQRSQRERFYRGVS